MSLTSTTSAPAIEDYTPLSEHEEQTPTSFFGAKPVLHLHTQKATIQISKTDLESQPALAELHEGSSDTDEARIPDIDVWVTSRNLILFLPSKSRGAQLSYQAIVVHAQEGEAVLLGLNLSDSNTADEDMVFIQLRIFPSSDKDEEPQQPNGHASSSPAQALFKAISSCQELNPDPPEDGDSDGEGGPAFDETAPGATGWITSENMHEFVGEDGEFRMPEGMAVIGGEEDGEGLGEGAGRTRTAAETDGENEAEEAKWQRTG